MTQPAMFSWQQPLAALFGGISAAGQPGGWSNFGAGVNQVQQQQQQAATAQQMAELRQMQIEQAQEEMRRSELEREQQAARQRMIQQQLGGVGQPVRQIGDVPGRTVGGAQGQSALLSGMNPQQSALFSTYAQVNPEAAFQMLTERAFAEPEPPKTVGGMFWDGDSYEPIPGYTEQQAAIAAAGRAPAAPRQRDIITLTGPDGKPVSLYEDDPRVAEMLAGGAVEGKPPAMTGQEFKQENTLRDEFNALTKDFRTVNDAYQKIVSTSDTGAGDMSMLYSYVKLLDPGSVVRESEFATAAASGSFGETVQGAVQRLATGERLPDSLRTAFKNEAKNLYTAQKNNYERVKSTYADMATRYNIDPTKVVWNYDTPETVTPDRRGAAGAQGGETEIDGYKIRVKP